MPEVRAGYPETGQRTLFDDGLPDGELVAPPEGGVRHGDPVCETPKATFIGTRPGGRGSVTVTMRDGEVVGDAPRDMRSSPALGTPMRLRQIAAVRGAWRQARVGDGRLRRVHAAVHEGCARNGRPWRRVLPEDGGALTGCPTYLKPDDPERAVPVS